MESQASVLPKKSPILYFFARKIQHIKNTKKQERKEKSMLNAKWYYKNRKVEAGLAEEFGVHPAILKILADHGVEGKEAVREFLEAGMEQVSNGMELTDMEKGVALIEKAIREKRRIRVMADYDVDGVTSCYILCKGIELLGGTCDHFIPHRVKDGYGLHEDVILKTNEDQVEVILTCDNGIAAAKEIQLAKELGMTVVVTDHHEVPYMTTEDGRAYQIPPADAVIDPKRPEDTGVFKEICGAVVAWKFMWNLCQKLGKEQEFQESDFLEIASLGTVCDVMELQKENRAIVKEGLKRMQNTKNVGLRALLEVLGLSGKPLTSYDYGFKIGPCINAEGRLDSANEAFALLTEPDFETAKAKAESMRALNEERQRLTKEGMEKAFQMVDSSMAEDTVLVVYLPEVHESIAGIIAGKVRERYNKPSIVLTKGEGDFLKGSGRSIEAYSMYDKLVEVKDLLLGFGGHPLAAGLSLKEENLEELRRQLNAKSGLTEADLTPKTIIDVILPVEFLTQKLIQQLDLLEPFGKGNERPVFAQKHVRGLRAEMIGQNKNVLRVTFDSRNCKTGVCFHNAEEQKAVLDGNGKLYDFSMLYYPSLNEFRGMTSIQAVISDIC